MSDGTDAKLDQDEVADHEARRRITVVETDIKWLKWISTATFVAILGQYAGIGGTVAEAINRHLP